MDFCTQVLGSDELSLFEDRDSSSEIDSGSDSEEGFDSGSDPATEEEYYSDEDSATYSDDNVSDVDSDTASNTGDTSEPLALVMAPDEFWPTEKYAKKKKKKEEKRKNGRITASSSGDSEIRIAFHPKGGHHSYVGTSNKNVPKDKPTMNLAINRNTPEYRVRRVVLHEFGHVLGCVHENSSPAARTPWNKRKVYAYYAKQGWDTKNTDRNILKTRRDIMQFSKFDKKSIMIYVIATELTTGGFKVPWNTVLSQTDKASIAMMYPPAVIRYNHYKSRINVSKSTHKLYGSYIT